MSELSDFLNLISEGKKNFEDSDHKGKLTKKLRESAKIELKVGIGDLFKELASLKEELKTLEEQPEEPKHLEQIVITEVNSEPIVEDMGTGQSDIDKYVKSDAFKHAKPIFTPPMKPDTSQVTVLGEKIKFLEQWISRIASTGPGSGEVNLLRLDDVDVSNLGDDRYLRYNALTKKLEFRDKDYIEVYDRSDTIAINGVPALLKPATTGGSRGITYDASTGEFTWLHSDSFTLSLVVNAFSDAQSQLLYIYAEQDLGNGWVIVPNSGKTITLVNNQNTQVVYSQAVIRTAGQKIRYYIYSNDGKVSLKTTTLPGISPSVYVPAIRIQYS